FYYTIPAARLQCEFFLETVKKNGDVALQPRFIQFFNGAEYIIRPVFTGFSFLSCGLSCKDQSGFHTGVMAAEDICVKPVPHYQGFLSGEMVQLQGIIYHGSARFSKIDWFSLHRMFQHLADGPAVRHIAEFDRAHIVQISSQVIYLTGAQDLTG